MEKPNVPILFKKLLPKDSTIMFNWDPKIGKNKYITKNKVIGRVGFEGDSKYTEIRSEISGKIVEMLENTFYAVEELKPDTLQIMALEPCSHSLVYEGTCSYCMEPNIKKHTQKIFDQISSISASEDHVNQKIEEITKKGEKLILILDLDNTIIHARGVPLSFDLSKEQPNLDASQFFEICQTTNTKYLVKKRDHLDAFLAFVSSYLGIWTYTSLYLYTLSGREAMV